ncbi:MAG: prepilin-type N-terminal cleavage/methylation domain-containing protein [Sideroxydans sp.]|jgi:MSHA pilin protein MshD
MSETKKLNKRVLTEAVMLARLNSSDEMREFFIEMWKQNPALAKQGGVRVQNLLSAVESKQRGISLIELIIFIVIISIGLTGILLVMNQTTAHSADPLIHKQAIAAAESLLEEIELQDFIDQNDGVTTVCPPASAVTAANRATDYHIVDCYNGFSMTGITDLNNNPTGLANYNASVTITQEALGSVAAGSAVRITVTVTDPQANTIAIDGYRTAY